MKTILLTLALFGTLILAKAQENIIQINGGYAFLTGEEVKSDFTGWRINGVYEFNPMGGALSHGFAFGYAGLSGISKITGVDFGKTVEIGNWPIYYQPKYSFGGDKLKAYVKGALGWQFSTFKVGSIKTNDSGFFGGGGAGVMFNLSETFYINAEYEIAWMSNYYYRDSWLNSAMGGIGVRF